MVEYVRNVKWLEVLGQRLERGGNKRMEGGMSGGKRHGGVGGGGGALRILLPAACLRINRPLILILMPAKMFHIEVPGFLQSGAWVEREHRAAYSSPSL